MRKIVLTVALGGAALLGLGASQAQAQDYPQVASLQAFTQPANYMSLPGVLRLRYYQSTGRWISRDEAIRALEAQGGTNAPAPTGQ